MLAFTFCDCVTCFVSVIQVLCYCFRFCVSCFKFCVSVLGFAFVFQVLCYCFRFCICVLNFVLVF